MEHKSSRHCGYKKLKSILSDNEFLLITFKSNDRFDGDGFMAYYRFQSVKSKSLASRSKDAFGIRHPRELSLGQFFNPCLKILSATRVEHSSAIYECPFGRLMFEKFETFSWSKASDSVRHFFRGPTWPQKAIEWSRKTRFFRSNFSCGGSDLHFRLKMEKFFAESNPGG